MNHFSLEKIRGCPDCGLLSELPETGRGVDINCPRCTRNLSRKRHLSMQHAMAYACAGLLFCLVLLSAPFIDVTLYGRYQTSTLWTGAEMLDRESLWPLSVLVLFTTLFLPILKLGFMICVLGGLQLEQPPHIIVLLFRWMKRISPWAMLEVFLLGFLVAYTRLQTMSFVQIDIAVYALVGAILSMAAADSIIDSEEVWNLMHEKGLTHNLQEDSDIPLLSCHLCHQTSRISPGAQCPRCQAIMHPRKHNSINRTWAFMIGAGIFYIPANYFPVMEITSLGKTTSHTIIGGMLELKEAGLWPLAVLVFIASIAIPFLKIISLTYILIATHRRSDEKLLIRTRIYRIMDFIGRWSMVDIFMISILVALIHFGQFAHIGSDIGAICFASVVIFTMIAVESFDSRLMWDMADKNRPVTMDAPYGY